MILYLISLMIFCYFKSWLELFPKDQYKHYDIYVLPKSNLDLYSLKRSSNFVFFEDLAKKNPHLEYISNYFKSNSIFFTFFTRLDILLKHSILISRSKSNQNRDKWRYFYFKSFSKVELINKLNFVL